MRRSSLLAIVVVIILIAIGAIALTHKSNNNNPSSNTSQSNTSNGSNSSNQPTAGTINIRNMMFTPPQISIAKGGTGTWTNNDTTTHTVVDDLSNVGGPNSGDIPTGGTYTFIFNKTGSFQYHDRLHTSMRGTIVVK